MAYQNGKTYYVIPLCATGDAAYNQKILNKQVQPLALNIQGTGDHYNNRNVNVYSLDWSTDMQWYLEVPRDAGYARFHCKGNPEYGLDYYYGSSNPGNCDIYKIIGNEEDSKINFRTVNASENIYRIQCYRNNADNDLYLTATGTSNGADVRWQPLDSSKAAYQTWWLVPIENVSANTPSTPTVPTTPNEIKDQEFFVKAYGTNLYLNVHGTDTVANSRNVTVYAKENCLAQKWIARQTTAGPKLFTSINQAYALNINTADNNCTMYTASGNDTNSVLAFEEVADMLYRIKMNNHNKYLRVDAGATSGSNVYWVSDINSATYWEFIPEDIIFPDSGQTPEDTVYLRKHNTDYFLSLDSNNNVVFSNANNAISWTLSGESNNCIIRPANNSSLILNNNNGVPIVSSSQNTDVYGVINSQNELTIHSSSSSNTRAITGSMLAVLNGIIAFDSNNSELFDVMPTASQDDINVLPSAIANDLNVDRFYFIKSNEKYLTFEDGVFYMRNMVDQNEIESQFWKVVSANNKFRIEGYSILSNSLGIHELYNSCASRPLSDYASNGISIIKDGTTGKFKIRNNTYNKCLYPDVLSPYWGGESNDAYCWDFEDAYIIENGWLRLHLHPQNRVKSHITKIPTYAFRVPKGTIKTDANGIKTITYEEHYYADYDQYSRGNVTITVTSREASVEEVEMDPLAINYDYVTSYTKANQDGEKVTYTFDNKTAWFAREGGINTYMDSLTGFVDKYDVTKKSGVYVANKPGYKNYYRVAVGPKVIMGENYPDNSAPGNTLYGTGSIDAVMSRNNKNYYIRCIVGDTKAHTWNNGVNQTHYQYYYVADKSQYGNDASLDHHVYDYNNINGRSNNSSTGELGCFEFIIDASSFNTEGFDNYSIEEFIFYND